VQDGANVFAHDFMPLIVGVCWFDLVIAVVANQIVVFEIHVGMQRPVMQQITGQAFVILFCAFKANAISVFVNQVKRISSRPYKSAATNGCSQLLGIARLRERETVLFANYCAISFANQITVIRNKHIFKSVVCHD
jgi:hypothetical protein